MLDKSLMENFLNACSSFHPCNDRSEVDTLDVRKFVYQIIWIGLKKELPDIVSALKEATNINANLLSVFADVLSIVDSEIICSEDEQLQSNFISLLSILSNVVPEGILKERLDPQTIEKMKLIPKLTGKLVKTKTRLFYKQQKYNLLREENEGYAKLITEVIADGSVKSGGETIIQNVMSLLGFFNLDPNRVLDILLEAFECRVKDDFFFLPLLEKYLKHCDVSSFCNLVGFKFQYYHHSLDSKTPLSLYKMTACLLRNNLIQIDDLYPHLEPSDNEIMDMNKTYTELAQEDARKINTVLLSGADGEEKQAEPREDFSDVDNQKFGLCLALLDNVAWEQALCILNRLPVMLFMSLPSASKSLCYLVHCTLEPLYRSKLCPKGAVGNVYRTHRGYPQPCLQYDQLNVNVLPMLLKLGPYVSTDPVLMVKVIRVAKGFMKEYHQATEIMKDNMKKIYASILTLIDEVLLPSLSLMECNCCVAEELWGLMKRFPFEKRYHLYALWKNYSYTSFPILVVTKAKTIKKAKYITKRLSKENVKQSGRQIGKLSHSNPCILFTHLLDQIQRYDNFIGPMVDSLKYLNPLAYDVLSFCVIEALSNPDKQRMKKSDTNLSQWLQSLSQFCGAVFKKYPIEITGLLQYTANQLKDGKSLDLLVLKEVVQKMSGIEASDEITQQQLEALAGGELLRAEGAYFGQIRNTRKPSLRLRDALIEGKLTIPLCLLIAQQRNAIVFVEQEAGHLKLVGKLYDQCQDNLIQFGGFLTLHLSGHESQEKMPSLDELHSIYGITPDIAYFLKRSHYHHQIQEKIKAIRKEIADQKELTTKQKTLEIEKKCCESCDDIFRPVVDSSIPLQNPRIWNNLSPLLYVTFWSLSMYDLYTPSDRYDDEAVKLKKSISEIDDNKELASSSKKKKEKDRCQLLMEKLEEEKKMQLDHNNLIRAWMESRKDAWFPSKVAKGETITQFLQLCVFPRCVFSAVDALYCAKFIQTTFSDVSYIVASLTENEASRYGRFLCAMLQMVMRWHADKTLYDHECANCPGFLTILRATNVDKATYLDYENFRHVCHKWQYKLTKALILGIESKDYTQIRNTLLVLIKILPYYPQVLNLGQALERRIEKIMEEEKENRPDLQALATGYNGMLKAKKSTMAPETEFHLKEKEAPKQTKISTSAKVEQELRDDEKSTRPVLVKKEKEEFSSKSQRESSFEKKIKSEASNTSLPRGERERTSASDENNEKKKKDRPSPKYQTLNSADKVKSEEKERKDKIKDRPKEKKSRTDSPINEEKKRKGDSLVSSPAHSTKVKDKEKTEKKTDRKRTNVETEGKESKRRKEESGYGKPKSKKH